MAIDYTNQRRNLIRHVTCQSFDWPRARVRVYGVVPTVGIAKAAKQVLCEEEKRGQLNSNTPWEPKPIAPRAAPTTRRPPAAHSPRQSGPLPHTY